MLIRGIASISRWDGSTKVARSDATFAGDIISDLRTKKNTLSVWYADSPESINDAVVAIALGRTSVSKVVALSLDEEDLDFMEIKMDCELGLAPGASEEILKRHRNMLEIDYKRLGLLSRYMLNLCRDKKKRIEKSEPEMVQLLYDYISNNRINIKKINSELKKKLKEKLEKKIGKELGW